MAGVEGHDICGILNSTCEGLKCGKLGVLQKQYFSMAKALPEGQDNVAWCPEGCC